MKKYNKKIAERILAMIRADTYTTGEICKTVGISRQTFYNWQNDHPEFAQAIEDVSNELLNQMQIEAKKSLMKKIRGYEVTETKVVTVPTKEKDSNGNPIPAIKEQITTKKHIQPDTTAIIFTLTNADPEHWRNRRTTEITGKNGKDFLPPMNDEELEREIAELQRKLDIENGFGSH